MRTSGQVSVGQEEQDVRLLVAVHDGAEDGEIGFCRSNTRRVLNARLGGMLPVLAFTKEQLGLDFLSHLVTIHS